MIVRRVVPAVLAFMLVLTGAQDCGGDIGEGGVKANPNTTAVLKCGLSGRVSIEANGNGYPRKTTVDVYLTLSGPGEFRQDEHQERHTGRSGSWSTKQWSWAKPGDGKYRLKVRVQRGGKTLGTDTKTKDC